MKLNSILKIATGFVILFLSHGILAKYIGYETTDCTGDKHEFDSYGDLTRSVNPVIKSYTSQADDDSECFEALEMEELVVTGTRIPPVMFSTLLTNIFYDTPARFWSVDWATINREWTDVEHWKKQAKDMEACWRNKASLNWRRITNSWHRRNLNAAMSTGYHVLADSNIDAWGMADPNANAIIINGQRILKDSHEYDLLPGFAKAQSHLHEGLHLGRLRQGIISVNEWGTTQEEQTVQMLAYHISKDLWDAEPPLGFQSVGDSEDSPFNDAHDRNSLDLEDLCK